MLIACPGREIQCKDVEWLLNGSKTEPTCHLPRNIADREREIILEAFERHQGNISAVSRDLDISRNKVYKKLKEARSRV